MNLDLQNKQWAEFTFEDIFNIDSSSSSIDKNKLNKVVGKTPYITRSEKSNGYDSFVGSQNDKYVIDEGNVITIGLDTQTVFYQPNEFYTGQNIQILRSKELNKYVAQFLVPLITRQMEKFNWGGNGATLTRLRRSKILLPLDEQEKPDYAFMEAYMRQNEQKKIDAYKQFVVKRLSDLEDYKEVENPDEKEWGEFEMEDVFHVRSGVRLTKADMKKGQKPFIGATDSNNGITEFSSNTNNSEDSNVLGVNYNGSVVENFYHPYTAIFSDDVKRLSFKNIEGNRHLYLFAKTQILKQRAKYQYGYKFNARRMSKQKIMLPINQEQKPDYTYMENYMKRLEYLKLKKYLEHKNSGTP